MTLASLFQGRIQIEGSYDELLKSGLQFAELLASGVEEPPMEIKNPRLATTLRKLSTMVMTLL